MCCVQGGVLLQDAGTSGRGADAAGSGRGRAHRAAPGGAQAATVGPEAADAALLKPAVAGAGGTPGRRKRRAEALGVDSTPVSGDFPHSLTIKFADIAYKVGCRKRQAKAVGPNVLTSRLILTLMKWHGPQIDT